MESDPERPRRAAARGTPPSSGGRAADRAFDELLRRHAVLGSDGASSRGPGAGTDAAGAGDRPAHEGGRPPHSSNSPRQRPPTSPPTNGRPAGTRPRPPDGAGPGDQPRRPPGGGRRGGNEPRPPAGGRPDGTRPRPPTTGNPTGARRPATDPPRPPTGANPTGNRKRPPADARPAGDRPAHPPTDDRPPAKNRGTGGRAERRPATGNPATPSDGPDGDARGSRTARSPAGSGGRPTGDRRTARTRPPTDPPRETTGTHPGAPDARPTGRRRATGPVATTTRGRPSRSTRTAPTDTAPPTTATPPAPTTPPADDDLGFNPDVLRVAVALLAALIVAVSGVAWTTKAWLNSSIPQLSALDRESPAIRNAAAQAGDENVVVLTTDFPTPGRPSDPRVGSIVVAHVPAGGSDVVALSIPTDLEINRPPCERWDPATGYLDQTVPAEARTTLLSAFEVGGPRCTTRVVQQVTGLAITRAVALDREGVATVAAAVGVDPCPDGAAPATERARVERDHRLLAAALRDTLSFSTLLAPPALLDLDQALPAAVVADGVGIDRLLGVAQALDALDAPGVTFAAAPTADAPNSRGHRVLDDADASALFKAVREDTALPVLVDPDTAPDIAAATGPSPTDVTVDVLNASGRDGLAAGVASTLTGFGFVVGEVGNAKDAAEATVVTHSPDQAAAAELLASTMPAATLAPEPGSTGVLEIVLGSSFDDVVRAPATQTPADLAPAAVDCT